MGCSCSKTVVVVVGKAIQSNKFLHWNTPLDYRIGLPHWITAPDYRIGLPHRTTASDYRWFASFEMATKQMHPMDFTGNISENWARWKELMELVLAGPSANKWTETQKAAQFLICIGQQDRDMARAWVLSGELSEDDKKSTSELFAIFETHCAPRKNVTIQRKLFYERKQSSGETIDEWITQLRLIATDCEFHNQDEMIRDMIVLNSVNKKVQ